MDTELSSDADSALGDGEVRMSPFLAFKQLRV